MAVSIGPRAQGKSIKRFALPSSRLRQAVGCVNVDLLIVCADIGSVARGNFGWWTSDGEGGVLPSELSKIVASAIQSNRPVALGFECPLFIPLNNDETKLTCARAGEGNRPWSAGAGCGALTTGLAQVAWVLRAIKQPLDPVCSAYLDWREFCAASRGLFLWEAFVSAKAKASSHVKDAEVAVKAFAASLPDPVVRNAVWCKPPVHSLIGAAMLRTGWSTNVAVLEQPCLVLKA